MPKGVYTRVKRWRGADCHPTRPHYAFGQCKPCYDHANRGRFQSTKPEATRRRYAATPMSIRRDRKLRRFGLTSEQFDALLAEQDGACAICMSLLAGGRWNTFAVDHDHKTNQVRGLLCVRCNRAIGLLADDVVVAERLVAYLKQKGKRKNEKVQTP